MPSYRLISCQNRLTVILLLSRHIDRHVHFLAAKWVTIHTLQESWTDFADSLRHAYTHTVFLVIISLETCSVLWTLRSGAGLRSPGLSWIPAMFLKGRPQYRSGRHCVQKYLSSRCSLSRMDRNQIRAKQANVCGGTVATCGSTVWNGLGSEYLDEMMTWIDGRSGSKKLFSNSNWFSKQIKKT